MEYDEEADASEFPPTSHLLMDNSTSSKDPRPIKHYLSRRRRHSGASGTISVAMAVKRSSARFAKFAVLLLICATSVLALSRISTRAVVASVAEGPASGAAEAQKATSGSTFELHEIEAPDGSIRASFLALGATLQSLHVKDRRGLFRDVVLGYSSDNLTQYADDPNHPYFGAIVGRYANRIKNGTFSIPPTQNLPLGAKDSQSRKVYHTTLNENDGKDTLHGGTPGWDRRQFVVTQKTSQSLTFILSDPAKDQGFPHNVEGRIEHTLQSGGQYLIKMSANADRPTPIMLSQHTYWNLDAYEDEASALDHHLQLKASQYVETDGILVPTGTFGEVEGTAYDFRQARQIGSRLDETKGYCGTGCTGYDTAFVYDKHDHDEPVLQMWSEKSGIKLSVTTDQTAVQIYSCNGIQSTRSPIPRKVSQGGPDAVYKNHTCVVIEQEQPIDAINNPQWHYDVVYGPSRPYQWNSVYSFSTLPL